MYLRVKIQLLKKNNECEQVVNNLRFAYNNNLDKNHDNGNNQSNTGLK